MIISQIVLTSTSSSTTKNVHMLHYDIRHLMNSSSGPYKAKKKTISFDGSSL